MSARFHYRQRLGAIPAVTGSVMPRNAVLHGDCVEVMRGLADESLDFILTDPPYLCHYRDRSGRTVLNDNDNHWLGPAFAQAYRLLKPDSVCVSFYGWNHADSFLAAWRAAGFRPTGHIVFVKRYEAGARYLAYRHECAYVLIKGNPPLPADPLPDVMPWQYTHNRLHPTQKPVSSLTPLIDAFCPARGLVLDPFCGSGSTLVAARECGRDWLGIELDARHHATATARLLSASPTR